MNKLRQSIKLVLFISVASLFFAACSDDDDKSIPVPEPSRMITGIKVHKISDVITYQGMISLTYDNKFPQGDASVKGVILSGSPFSVYDESAFKIDLNEIRGKHPIINNLLIILILLIFYPGLPLTPV